MEAETVIFKKKKNKFDKIFKTAFQKFIFQKIFINF